VSSGGPIGVTFDSIIQAAESAKPTKRGIVSAIGKLYDPIGFLSPLVIKFKVFMQALFIAKVGWDKLIPEPLRMRWQVLVSELRNTRFQGRTFMKLDKRFCHISYLATVMHLSLHMLL